MDATRERPTNPPYTKTQGRYLAFIYYYTKLHGQPPAEHDMQQYFQTTPPTVHNMVKTLHKRGLIERTPGKARTIRVLLPRESLPDLDCVYTNKEQGASAMNKPKSRRTAVPDVCKMYQLRIELPPIDPPIWRRLLVRGDISLGLLHAAIQVSMGWTNSHLHSFSVGEKTYSDPKFRLDEFPGDEPTGDEGKTTLMKIAPRAKARFIYEYDFGDSWQHLITVEKILEPDASFTGFAKCVAGARACPPEDCGGPWGYHELLKVIKKPKHEEYETMMEWLGDDFDSETFDIEETNKYLQKLKWPRTTIDQLGTVLMERDDYQG